MNFETVSCVPPLMKRGEDWWRKGRLGRNYLTFFLGGIFPL